MASKELSTLRANFPHPGVDGTELVHVEQGGNSRAYTLAEFFAALGAQHYHYGSFAADTIGASEILMDHIVATAHTLADEFADNVASAGTPPADGDWIADVQIEGVSVGSLTIDALGAVTWSTNDGAIAVAAGEVVTVVAPAVADSAIARLRFTFKGEI